MKKIVVVIALALLAGCGVESATTAATVAAAKKQELEQGRKVMGEMQQNIDRAMAQSQQSAQRADETAR